MKRISIVGLVLLLGGALWYSSVFTPKGHRLDGAVLLTDQLIRNPSFYDGKEVKVACFVRLSGGISVSSTPLKLSEFGDSRQKQSDVDGTLLAKASDGWDNYFPYEDPSNRSQFFDENLVIVSGTFHAKGYQKTGLVLEAEPFLKIKKLHKIAYFVVE